MKIFLWKKISLPHKTQKRKTKISFLFALELTVCHLFALSTQTDFVFSTRSQKHLKNSIKIGTFGHSVFFQYERSSDPRRVCCCPCFSYDGK